VSLVLSGLIVLASLAGSVERARLETAALLEKVARTLLPSG